MPSATTTTVRAVRLDVADTAYLEGVSARLRTSQGSLTVAQIALGMAGLQAAAASAALTHANATVAALTGEERAAIAEVKVTHDRLRDLAVSAYLAGGPAGPISNLLASRSVDDYANRAALVSSVAKTDAAALRRYIAARRRASTRSLRALADQRHDQDVKRAADQAQAAASDLVVRRTNDVSDTAQLLQLVTAAVGYPGTDIPRLVLDAYRRAAATVQRKGCRLSWAALAAIGKVESDHGRSQGAQLTITGEFVPTIVGPSLDGQNGRTRVSDTDHGWLDGDALNIYETAVGPMQFLPSTWVALGRDGNGDGVADPNNIYDATLTAATGLCRDAPPDQLDTDPALQHAFFAYNHSDGYVAEVLALTHLYAGVPLAP